MYGWYPLTEITVFGVPCTEAGRIVPYANVMCIRSIGLAFLLQCAKMKERNGPLQHSRPIRSAESNSVPKRRDYDANTSVAPHPRFHSPPPQNVWSVPECGEEARCIAKWLILFGGARLAAQQPGLPVFQYVPAKYLGRLASCVASKHRQRAQF